MSPITFLVACLLAATALPCPAGAHTAHRRAVSSFGFEQWMTNTTVDTDAGDRLTLEAMAAVQKEFSQASVKKALTDVLVAQCKLEPDNVPSHVLATLHETELCLVELRDSIPDISKTTAPGYQIRYQVAVTLVCSYVPVIFSCFVPTIAKVFGCHGDETAAKDDLSLLIADATGVFCEDREFLTKRFQEQPDCIQQGWLTILQQLATDVWEKPTADKDYLCQIIVTVRDTIRTSLQTKCGYATIVTETQRFFKSLLDNVGCSE